MYKILFHCLAGGSLLVSGAAVQAQTGTGDTVVKPAPAPVSAKVPAIDAPVSVSSPDEHSDAELYDLLMTEYPGWLKLARGNGLLK